jgi:hypothetical protein
MGYWDQPWTGFDDQGSLATRFRHADMITFLSAYSEAIHFEDLYQFSIMDRDKLLLLS